MIAPLKRFPMIPHLPIFNKVTRGLSTIHPTQSLVWIDDWESSFSFFPCSSVIVENEGKNVKCIGYVEYLNMAFHFPLNMSLLLMDSCNFIICQEYVVEDRENNKNIPELDPSHITELRMLGLY
ncbi:hypothetical protein JRO89_XS09G0049200 [Xanthoceras sorbifolium]|uniref:Uncharacterized protein n=1 Tax=Xanthoceras sorbifolium TaxID=99658 RepID=A0ABQ8HKN1_9ROSI|nr:hypothetical protein JRO89_XS09G0049200 [Xanthoceras sorbifolium]